MAFLFIPLMAASMSGIAREKMGNGTSIYNLMRNIGGGSRAHRCQRAPTFDRLGRSTPPRQS